MYYPPLVDLIAAMRAEDPRLKPKVREHSCQTCGDPTKERCDDCGKPTCENHVIDVFEAPWSLDVCEKCAWEKRHILTTSCIYCGRTNLGIETECAKCKADMDSVRDAA